MPINADDIKTYLWRSGFVIQIWYNQNKFYDDLLLVFCGPIFIFVIIFWAKSSSLSTYDKNGDFVINDIPFCNESEQRYKQIVTDSNFSGSASVHQHARDMLPIDVSLHVQSLQMNFSSLRLLENSFPLA
jgi:hypothetical protein